MSLSGFFQHQFQCQKMRHHHFEIALDAHFAFSDQCHDVVVARLGEWLPELMPSFRCPDDCEIKWQGQQRRLDNVVDPAVADFDKMALVSDLKQHIGGEPLAASDKRFIGVDEFLQLIDHTEARRSFITQLSVVVEQLIVDIVIGIPKRWAQFVDAAWGFR